MPGRQLGSRVVARCCEVGMVDGSSSVRAGGGPPEWETGGEGPATPVGVAAAGQRLPLLNQLSPTWDTRAPTLHCPPHQTNSTAKQTRPPGAPSPQHRSLGSAGSELVVSRARGLTRARGGFPAPASPRGRGQIPVDSLARGWGLEKGFDKYPLRREWGRMMKPSR